MHAHARSEAEAPSSMFTKLLLDFQSGAVGEGGGHPEGEDPPPGRHAEEPAEESQTHD